jgi:hypothetical protein
VFCQTQHVHCDGPDVVVEERQAVPGIWDCAAGATDMAQLRYMCNSNSGARSERLILVTHAEQRTNNNNHGQASSG